MHRTVLVDRLECPKLWQNLQECAYDKKKPHPAMAKTNDQHGIDWLLHAVHESSGMIHVQRPKVKTNVFGKPEKRKMRL